MFPLLPDILRKSRITQAVRAAIWGFLLKNERHFPSFLRSCCNDPFRSIRFEEEGVNIAGTGNVPVNNPSTFFLAVLIQNCLNGKFDDLLVEFLIISSYCNSQGYKDSRVVLLK